MDDLDLAAAERRLWDAVDVHPIEHRLELPRIGTTVRVQEVGSGPPAVFVHGGSVAGTNWVELVAGLPDVRCLVVDRPGCGGSDPLPGAVDLEQALAVGDHLVADVLDALDVPSAAVVATSAGGLEAFRGAGAHPDRIERLLLFGWCLGVPGTRAPWWIRTMALPGAARLMGVVPMSTGALRASLRRFGMGRALDEGTLTEEMLAWLVALYRDTDTLRQESMRGSVLMTVREGWRDVVPAGLLAALQVPVRLIWGDEDPFIDEGTAARLVAVLPRGEQCRLDRAGHAPWVDRPSTCVAQARSFLVGPQAGG